MQKIKWLSLICCCVMGAGTAYADTAASPNSSMFNFAPPPSANTPTNNNQLSPNQFQDMVNAKVKAQKSAPPPVIVTPSPSPSLNTNPPAAATPSPSDKEPPTSTVQQPATPPQKNLKPTSPPTHQQTPSPVLESPNSASNLPPNVEQATTDGSDKDQPANDSPIYTGFGNGSSTGNGAATPTNNSGGWNIKY